LLHLIITHIIGAVCLSGVLSM